MIGGRCEWRGARGVGTNRERTAESGIVHFANHIGTVSRDSEDLEKTEVRYGRTTRVEP